ncbi:hypothetical protein Cni_G06383 [Canna indica]|uniref:Uncharacterized protein n=1 Tax=Canna indica TaxID=4628 RepID=A0AAQ3Q5W1_9LILI|nr:hypothetical protein Cni_G06383 [Canna indica]
MGEGSSSGLSTPEISTSESPTKDPQLVDSTSNGWTDEKHILFLNSIEADFVNDLYKDQYHSNAFQGWLSRMKKHKRSSGPYENDLKCCQFKVLQGGCWENLRFETGNNHTAIESGSSHLSANPWIQHFRAPSLVKEIHFNTSDRCGDAEIFRSSVQLANELLGVEATDSKHICHQDSIGCSTEMSDQNFIADELIVGKQSSKICRKRRQRTALVHEPINDQVVPSQKTVVMESSDENPACLPTINAGSSARTPEVFPGFLPTDTGPPLCENQEVNS